MSDETVASAVRGTLNAYDMSVPDGELAELADVYSALRRSVERVLVAEPVELDIAVTFDPAAD